MQLNPGLSNSKGAPLPEPHPEPELQMEYISLESLHSCYLYLWWTKNSLGFLKYSWSLKFSPLFQQVFCPDAEAEPSSQCLCFPLPSLQPSLQEVHRPFFL